MLDLEALGTSADSVILSISAIQFDLDTGDIGKIFNAKVNPRSCVDLGLEIDPKTLSWWLSLGNETVEHLSTLMNGKTDINLVLDDLQRFIALTFWGKDFQIWANSNRFNLGILENAYRKCHLDIPWDRNKERDVKTLLAMFPSIVDTVKFNGLKHNSYDDCLHQINCCNAIYNTIRDYVG